MPNLFAYFVIFLWPFVALRLSKKLPTDKAVIALFLIPFLLLPEKTAVNVPGLPSFDKSSIPPMIAFLIFFFRFKKSFKLLPDSTASRFLLFCLFVFPVFTTFTNPSSLHYGPRVLSGLGFGDIVSMEFVNLVDFYIPFILAYNFLRTPQSHETFVKLMVVAGLFYTIPMLYEIRMSPQLHSDIYGFFPHDFRQQKRQGGFRPVVFLGHGLEVAIFIAMATIGAIALLKAKLPPLQKLGVPKLLYLWGVVVLCKSMGALLYTLLATPLLLLLRAKKQVKILSAIALIVFFFPILRGEQIVPVTQVVEFFQGINEERANSLMFRIENENLLLDKADEKRFFGWGGWGRARVYDPGTGRDLSVTDGFWIIIFGQYGWLGYIAIFGLLCYPVVMLYQRSRRDVSVSVSSMTACLGAMLIFNLIDLIPNSSLTHITVLLAGAIQGWAANRDRGSTEVSVRQYH